MKRFFQRISEKAKDVTLPPVLIVALGDSVTQGMMEQHFLDSEGVYHRLLQQELEAFFPTTTFTTINAGVSGGTATQALTRLERDVLRHTPDLVLIAFGLNDSGEGLEGLKKFKNSMQELVTRIQSETPAGVLLLTPPFMAHRKSFRIHPDHAGMAEGIISIQTGGILEKYAEAIREVAGTSQVALVDIHREWIRLAQDGLDTDLWLSNGLNHPDRRGHKLAASLAFHTLLGGLMPEIVQRRVAYPEGLAIGVQLDAEWHRGETLSKPNL